MTYGMQVAWRGKTDSKQLEAMQRVQYQALLKAAGGVQGSKRGTIDHIAAVEDIMAKLESMERRYAARKPERPEFNKDFHPTAWSLERGLPEDKGREWHDHSIA